MQYGAMFHSWMRSWSNLMLSFHLYFFLILASSGVFVSKFISIFLLIPSTQYSGSQKFVLSLTLVYTKSKSCETRGTLLFSSCGLSRKYIVFLNFSWISAYVMSKRYCFSVYSSPSAVGISPLSPPWMITNLLSLVSHISSSMHWSPMSMAFSKALSVFSGSFTALNPPRWPQITTPWWLSDLRSCLNIF